MADNNSSLRASGAPALASTIADAAAHWSAAVVARENVRAALRICDHHLGALKYRQTTADPKANGYAYAEIPDWSLRQLRDRLATLLDGSLEQFAAAAPADTYESRKHEGEAEVTNTSGGQQ